MLRRPNSRRNGLVALGAALLAGGFAILPLVIREKRADRNLMLSDSALSGSQIMRGNYLNSGSKDVGRDPDWDPATGTYRGVSNGNFDPSPEQVETWRRQMGMDFAENEKRRLEKEAQEAKEAAAGGGGGGGGEGERSAR